MNLPSFPTDNMYKFMSIFGLALIISSFFIYEIRSDTLWEKSLKLQEMNFSNKAQEERYINEIIYDIKYISSLVNFQQRAGSVLTVSGFVLWYLKLQRYQDKIIISKAKAIDKKQKGKDKE